MTKPTRETKMTAPEASPADEELRARRRLLKLGAYVPPAVLGMMILGGLPRNAEAVVGSCAPSACQPCIDVAAGINSKNGKPLTAKQANKKRRKCNKKQACMKMPGNCGPNCVKGGGKFKGGAWAPGCLPA